MKHREAITLIGLTVVAVASSAAGTWWLFWSAVAGALAGTLTGPVLRYYRIAPRPWKRLMVAMNQVFALTILGFYLSLIRGLTSSDGSPVVWLPWLLVLAVPVAIFGMGIVAWRRIDHETNTLA